MAMLTRWNLVRVSTAALSALGLAACAAGGTDDGTALAQDRELARDALERTTGARVTLEVNGTGTTRVLAMTSPALSSVVDPAGAAIRFLADHGDVFELTAAEAASFVVTRVDVERTGLRHVTLQRTFAGIPVFQGAITVHMDASNGVFRALGDDFYRVSTPTNRQLLTPADAALASSRALGLGLAPVLAASDGQRTTFTAAGALDPINVEPRIFEVAAGDDRFAYQATVSWLDDTRQQHYELVLVDAQDGALLAEFSLVNTFTGRVFTASPGANPTTDTRVVASFDGNPAASPIGWVDSTRKTRGNNVISATDLDGNNTVGANEIQPTADANNAFDFPFDPLQDSSLFKDAAVATAFFLANDWHDRTYLLGFTEAAGNFQTNNFGNGGAGNDEVQQDVQDGSGLNNANFATPPDGSRPRMQMFLFTINGGVKEDGDFDPTVIYHENTHGLSNRLVGGGSTGCLRALQSGGMGEGWSDWVAASFLNDPVIGAYVTGNATRGIRRFSMAASPFTYNDIKNGTLAEVHDVGELWAATLFDIRTALGAGLTEQLVVSGMKLTPCNPSMISARDAILQADVNLTGGANRCTLFAKFAGRLMGDGASSPTDSSTTTIVTSSNVPPDCGGGGGAQTRTFAAADLPKAIPDNSATGATSLINVTQTGLDVQQVKVSVNITHQARGDLVIQVIAPNGETATLSNRQGGQQDDFVVTNLDISASFTTGSPASGQWRLFVRDLARRRTGTINSFSLAITSSN
jgi:subtilisin-like proprotein convertase family protein